MTVQIYIGGIKLNQLVEWLNYPPKAEVIDHATDNQHTPTEQVKETGDHHHHDDLSSHG